jgi:hypothetical protein
LVRVALGHLALEVIQLFTQSLLMEVAVESSTLTVSLVGLEVVPMVELFLAVLETLVGLRPQKETMVQVLTLETTVVVVVELVERVR